VPSVNNKPLSTPNTASSKANRHYLLVRDSLIGFKVVNKLLSDNKVKRGFCPALGAVSTSPELSICLFSSTWYTHYEHEVIRSTLLADYWIRNNTDGQYMESYITGAIISL